MGKRRKAKPAAGAKLPVPTGGDPAMAGTSSRVAVLASRQVTTTFTGPLPPPEILKEYEAALPGCADRLLRLAEEQAAHRRQLEAAMIRAEIRKSYFGQASGFLVALAGFGVGGWLVYTGHDAAGSGFLVGALGSIVWTFLHGTNARKEERTERLKALTGHSPSVPSPP